jgi:hypothetical protein
VRFCYNWELLWRLGAWEIIAREEKKKGELDKGPDQAVGGHYRILINKPLYDVIGNQERFCSIIMNSFGNYLLDITIFYVPVCNIFLNEL